MATIPLVDEISNEMLPQYYGAIPNNSNVVVVDFLKLERGDEKNKISEEEREFLMSNLCLFRLVRVAHKNILKNPSLKYLQYCNYFYEYFDKDKTFFVGLMYAKRCIDNAFIESVNEDLEHHEVFT